MSSNIEREKKDNIPFIAFMVLQGEDKRFSDWHNTYKLV